MSVHWKWCNPAAATGILEPLKLLAFTEPYAALPVNTQEVASPRGEISNQLLETLEEWNDYLER
jgi:hypothetical protein